MQKPLPLSITTRGIGINLCSFYANAAGYIPTTSIREFELPKIYASYRALLALLESRFLNVVGRMVFEGSYTNFSPKLRKYDNFTNIPIIFKRLVEAIYILKYRDIVYVPAMAENTFIGGKFIPRPENIILSNLQQTVNALTEASDDTFMHRKIFYEYNPIPGAIWNVNNYTLMNAHEIIPPEYHLHEDVNRDMWALRSLSRRLRKYSNYINNDCAYLDVTGSFSSFICNKMGDLRVPDRKSEEELYDYYRNCIPENNIDSFYSRILLRNKKVIQEGTLFLLGEYPNDESIAKPIYALRSEHQNSYFYTDYNYMRSYISFLCQ